MDKKIKYLVVLVAIIIIVIITGTFAWLTFRSNKTAMVLTIGDLNDAVVTLQPYQINTSIVPNTTFSEQKSVVVNVEAKNNTNVNKKVRLYYRINEIDDEDFRYRITRKKDNESSFTVYKNGDFSGAVNGQDYEILNEEVPEGKTYDYKVYVWLNGSSSQNAQGSSFNGELRADINTNYMRADVGENSDTEDVFDSGILRSNIETITFQNTIPNNITNSDQPIDVSLNGDNSVIAYFKDANSNSKYEMYIAANGMIVATSLEKFFNRYMNVTTINNLNYLDTSQVTSMYTLFQRCDNLVSLDLSSWDTSNVISMVGMFNYCYKLTILNISNFNTSKVTSMYAMFNNCISLQELNLSSFDTSKVTNMQTMFASSSNEMSLSTIVGIENFNTSSVTDMSGMFQHCSNLTSLDLSSWNTSKVTTMKNMFYICSNLSAIYVSDLWNVNNVSDSVNMFKSATNLPNFDSSVIDKTNAHYGTGGYLTLKTS